MAGGVQHFLSNKEGLLHNYLPPIQLLKVYSAQMFTTSCGIKKTPRSQILAFSQAKLLSTKALRTSRFTFQQNFKMPPAANNSDKQGERILSLLATPSYTYCRAKRNNPKCYDNDFLQVKGHRNSSTVCMNCLLLM